MPTLDAPINYGNISFEVFHLPNTTKGECRWNSLNTGMMCILFVTFILNLFSSVVLFRVPLVTVRGRSNPVYLCIRFLNVCDVLQAFLLIVMPVFATPDCGWMGGEISCSIMGFLVLFFVLVSPLITILMAFDRVIALYKPFKYRSHLGLKMLKILLPVACVSVLFLTALPLFKVGEYHVVKGRRFCLLDTITDDPVGQGYVLCVHSIFLIALLFMLACTITFQIKLVRMTIAKKQEKGSRKKTSSRRTRNATITTMAVCCIFIVCYMPYVIRVLFEASTLHKSPLWITWITFGLSFFQPLLNPVVYVGTNARYRQELQAMIRNLSATDIDSSSESGGTHIVSRGPWAGFRRRMSSGGPGSKPGSRHGSSKRKTHGSQGASTTSYGDSLKGRRSANSTLRKQNDVNSSHHTLSDMRITDIANNPCYLRRDPSSSSGVKSFDSKDMFPISPPHTSPPTLSGSLSKFFPENMRYGRGEKRELSAIYSEDGDMENSEARERSNTVSGDNSPCVRTIDDSNNFSLKKHCASVPLLLEKNIALARLAASKAKKQSEENTNCTNNGNVQSLPYLDIPFFDNKTDKCTDKYSEKNNDLHFKYNSCISSINSMFDKNANKDENVSSNEDSAVITECFNITSDKKTTGQANEERLLADRKTNKNEAILPLIVEPKPENTDIQTRLPVTLMRTEARSSYKRALGSPIIVERKPSKRDSGVDADEIR